MGAMRMQEAQTDGMGGAGRHGQAVIDELRWMGQCGTSAPDDGLSRSFYCVKEVYILFRHMHWSILQ